MLGLVGSATGWNSTPRAYRTNHRADRRQTFCTSLFAMNTPRAIPALGHWRRKDAGVIIDFTMYHGDVSGILEADRHFGPPSTDSEFLCPGA